MSKPIFHFSITLLFVAIGLCGVNQSSALASWKTSETAGPSPAASFRGDSLPPVRQDSRSRSPLDPVVDAKRLTTNLKAFGVPFNINANQDAFIEVQLYLSRDQGRTWTFHSRQTTDQDEFRFEADADGEYWFALKTLNRDRQLLPAGDPQPQLKIVVDSVKPKLDFRVQTDNAGRVVCRWRASDSSLMPRSLKIFYQPVTRTGSLKSWMKVPVQLAGQVRNGVYTDQVGFWPETDEATVNVAVEIQDAAGNATRVDRRVNVPATAWKSRNQATARPQPYATARPSYGSQSPSAMNQPDWAQPGWQPSSEGQAGANQTARATPRPSKSAGQSAEPQPAAKPPNVICENGVCQIIGDGNGSFDSASKRFTPNANATPATQVANQTRPGSLGVRSAQVGQLPLNFVGSPEEYAAPPVPPGLVRQAKVAQRGDSVQESDSVTWESEGQAWLPHQQSVSATTRRIDPGITPGLPEATPTSPNTFVPANPATNRIQGDQFISESTTQSPRNQYQGGITTTADLPAPELLPDNSNVAKESSDQDHRAERLLADRTRGPLPSTGDPGFQESNHGSLQRLPVNPGSETKQGAVFSGAGFRRASETNEPASVVEPYSAKPLRETRAPIQMISSTRFRLNYGIDSIDPSGVGRVVLWVTRDDGSTWNQWGTDPDNRSPFPVEVEQQGRYGFRIVVHSKDGLTGQGPASGDDADIWIHVDTQAPLTKITSVPYGRGAEVGKLVINYSVADSFLSLRPITLAWSQTKSGPWNVIEAGVRNEGRYVWHVDRQLPDQIYLKIEATDRSGNVGMHTLSRPIDVSGLVPRGRIHGVTPVGK